MKESNLWHKLLRKVGLEKSPKESIVLKKTTAAVVKEPYIEENIMLGRVREPQPEPPEAIKELIKQQF